MADDASRSQRFTRERSGDARGPGATARRGTPANEQGMAWCWLFAIPLVATLLPWIYNTRDPELFGVPFFYWYQMAWVPITVVLTIFVYRKTKGPGA